MTGQNHIRLGLLAGAVAAYMVDGNLRDVILPATVGALWPDTDTRQSILGRVIPLWKARGISHRGFTHSHVAAVMFALIWDRFFHDGWWFLLGYISHIWVDLGVSFIKRKVKRCRSQKKRSWKRNAS